MKTLLCLFLLTGSALASDLTIRPRFPTIGNDPSGLMAPGSFSNPWVVRGDNGREVGTIRPQFPSIGNPPSGLMAPGSFGNPYRLHFDDN